MRHRYKPRKKFFFLVPIFILFAITAIVMWLWNSILPNVLGVKTINYWQAMGILVLSKILFGGFSGCGKHRRRSTRKRKFIDSIKNMSPEEREKFKSEWKQRFNNKHWC